MKLSTKGRYGLRAMVDLADHGETAPVSISSISARQDISVSYLEQLLARLRRAGLVRSIRGAQGGYVLARDARMISVGEILIALEGDLNPVNCAELTNEGDGEGGCSGSQYCVTKYVWKRIKDSIQDTVNNIWLSELVEDSRKIQYKPFVRKCEN